MPRVKKSELLATGLLAFLIMAIVGAACLRVSTAGGPGWIEGHELEIFLKFGGLTLAAAIAEISWRAVATTSVAKRR